MERLEIGVAIPPTPPFHGQLRGKIHASQLARYMRLTTPRVVDQWNRSDEIKV